MNLSLRGLLLLTGLLLTSLTLHAQSGRLRAANKQYEAYSYLSAVRLYEDFLRTKPANAAEAREALTKLAFSYRKLHDDRNAERVYGDLVTNYTDLDSEVYLYYAQALASNHKYRESQKMYSQYGQRQSNDLRGRANTIAYMDLAPFFTDSSSYRIQNLPINSRQADFSPMYYKKGLVFVSSRDEGGVIKRVFSWNQTPFLDLYSFPDTNELRIPGFDPIVRQPATAVLGGGGPAGDQSVEVDAENRPLSKTEKFSRTLNTKYHEGPVTFTQDQNFIVFTRNSGSKSKSGKSSDGVRKLKLYSAVFRNNKWHDVTDLPFNNNDYSVGHPAFAPDDQKLYFVSDMPGGYGGTDLYVVEYRGGEWGTPVNMGKEINTEGNEMFPYVDSAGNLYFASDGHAGLGGLDIFYAELRDGVLLRDVQNVGYPINSEKDDFGLITDRGRTSGYFSSNRRKGISLYDLYSFRRSCKQLNILVFDARTGAALPAAEVRIVRNGTNQEIKMTDVSGKT